MSPPPPPPPTNILVFSCSETASGQSEAKILIELLDICFIDNTDLVLWLTYCMKSSIIYGANMSKSGGGGGGGGGAVAPLPCPPPFSYTTVSEYSVNTLAVQ